MELDWDKRLNMELDNKIQGNEFKKELLKELDSWPGYLRRSWQGSCKDRWWLADVQSAADYSPIQVN